MSSIQLPDGVEDHSLFQRRVWAVQRLAWILFAILLVACLLGLLGRGGLFSSQTVTLAGASLEIPSISRWNAPDEIRVTFASSADARTLLVNKQFFEAFSVETIDPPPMTTIASHGRVGYAFPPDMDAETVVVLRLQTQFPWLHEFEIGTGSDIVKRSVFIFP
ncbi:protein-L-isoaspartate(D-aspartate) O-methyltransferase [Rhizobium tibeticum]|uniref:hypothetical protein n=1 Tax=Rhizobium tibeticum TaxID=501024 RepID=UPI00278A65BE|nr:hypothetical protein [Rhizobium tibeticum]MDP9813493.1 protein-L-isoaspartate(D-aspartate) O-methyltransferase [Rhizobium tibeticum]